MRKRLLSGRDVGHATKDGRNSIGIENVRNLTAEVGMLKPSGIDSHKACGHYSVGEDVERSVRLQLRQRTDVSPEHRSAGEPRTS